MEFFILLINSIFDVLCAALYEKYMKEIAISGLIIALTPFNAYPLSGTRIIENAFQANFVENFMADIELTTKTANGKQSSLGLSFLGKGDLRDALSLLIVFKSPPSARGMKLLVKSRQNTPTTAYVYMPDMGKYVLLSGESRNMKLGESEINLNDLVSAIPWDGIHQLLQESEYSGHPCYVVETHLPGEKEKRVTWIDKDSFLPVNTQYFDLNGSLIKTLTATKFIKAFGKNRIVSLRMTNHQNMNITTLAVLSGKWHLDMPAALFEPENLSLPISELIDFDRKSN